MFKKLNFKYYNDLHYYIYRRWLTVPDSHMALYHLLTSSIHSNDNIIYVTGSGNYFSVYLDNKREKRIDMLEFHSSWIITDKLKNFSKIDFRCFFKDADFTNIKQNITLQDFSNNTKTSDNTTSKKNNTKVDKIKLNDIQKKSIVTALENLYFNKDLVKKIAVSTNLLDWFLENDIKLEDKSPGIVLNGPPGTGKTFILDCFKNIYNIMDFKVESLNLSVMGNTYIKSFMLDFKKAIDKIKNTHKSKGNPILLTIDEADIILRSQSSGENSGKKDNYYIEVISYVKQLIQHNSEFNKMVTVIFTTNLSKKEIDPALIRDLRLSCLYVDNPSDEIFNKMIKDKILNLYPDIKISKDEWVKLSSILKNKKIYSGASIVKLVSLIKKYSNVNFDNFSDLLDIKKKNKIIKYKTIIDVIENYYF